jgi:radical SAM protein with 4Fe4S-binding SPASM domain
MLPVSDLIEIARREISAASVGERAPQRFSRRDQQAPVIVWNVCRHCDMSCPHCYAAAAYRPSPEDLTTAEAIALLDEMAACGVRVVIFSGGEPMLRADLLELVAHASEIGIAPQLSSNGVHIDAEAAAKLAAAGVAYVGISIDGLRDFNDAYRGMQGGFDAALHGLTCAKAAGMRTGLRMTLTARNADRINPMLEIACAADVDRFYVSHLLYSGRGARMAAEDLSRADARDLLEGLFASADSLLEQRVGTRIVTGANDSDGPLLVRWIEDRYGRGAAQPVHELLLGRGGNSAGEKLLNVDHKGRVHPDQFWRGETLGDVRRDSFESILKHPLREQLRNRAEYLTGRCGACTYQSLCRGSHRERAIACSGDMWSSDPACVLEDFEIGMRHALSAEEQVV